ncbi:hypothetical protein [Cronobacter dublinensis]|uniref:hypothetical protein n=1 Tax=Cronobacter dublinensis TaxID=413497 RepID=UPI001F45C27A|nr:hypothetical protein [Cronobacter dublinensis]
MKYPLMAAHDNHARLPHRGATRYQTACGARDSGSMKRRKGFLRMISCRAPRRFAAVYPDFHASRRCGAKAAILIIGIM